VGTIVYKLRSIGPFARGSHRWCLWLYSWIE